MLQIYISCWGRGGLHPEILKSLIPTFSLLPACTPQRCHSRNQGGTLKRRRLFIEHVHTSARELRPLCCKRVWQIWRNAGGSGEGHELKESCASFGGVSSRGCGNIFQKCSIPVEGTSSRGQNGKISRSGWWGTLANGICESGLPTQCFAHFK